MSTRKAGQSLKSKPELVLGKGLALQWPHLALGLEAYGTRSAAALGGWMRWQPGPCTPSLGFAVSCCCHLTSYSLEPFWDSQHPE